MSAVAVQHSGRAEVEGPGAASPLLMDRSASMGQNGNG